MHLEKPYLQTNLEFIAPISKKPADPTVSKKETLTPYF